MSIQRLPLIVSTCIATALATSAQTQSVKFRGKVEDVSGMPNVFIVDCTGVHLTSGTIALQTFVGQQTTIEGQWNTSLTDPSVEVTTLTPAFEDFEIGGSAKIGEIAKLHVIGTPGNTFLFFGSLESGFFPLQTAGAVLIDAPTAEILGSGTISAAGFAELDGPIPNAPALIGLSYKAQALVRDVPTNTYMLTTVDCITFEMP